ncbi:MAG TPA: hypothetical protein VES95_12515 [Dermatophilaceae bacterium]|nr:hypothetical protein [Dermatophilaceae bacterium]
MPELPASVRLALWVTGAWAAGEPLATAVARALPDAEPASGVVARLALWHELGERAVLVALPASGDLTAVPGASRETRYAVVAAGECLLAPALGAVLVPTLTVHGPGGSRPAGTLDRVTVLDLGAHSADPVPRHRVEALDARAAARGLLQEVGRSTAALERVGGTPFDARSAHASAGHPTAAEWALPSRLAPRVLEAVRLAGAVGTAARAGLEGPHDAVDAVTREARDGILRSLARAADVALAEATNAGVAALAGWVPAR